MCVAGIPRNQGKAIPNPFHRMWFYVELRKNWSISSSFHIKKHCPKKQKNGKHIISKAFLWYRGIVVVAQTSSKFKQMPLKTIILLLIIAQRSESMPHSWTQALVNPTKIQDFHYYTNKFHTQKKKKKNQ